MSEDKKKIGRPRSYKPSKNIVTIRLTDEQLADLEFCSSLENSTKSKLIKDGIRAQINLIKFRHRPEN